jgi:hypothetical protein
MALKFNSTLKEMICLITAECHKQTTMLQASTEIFVMILVNTPNIMWRTDTLLGKDLETNNEYSRCYETRE